VLIARLIRRSICLLIGGRSRLSGPTSIWLIGLTGASSILRNVGIRMASSWLCRSSGWCLPDHRACRSVSLRTQLPQLLLRRRLSRMRCQCLLLFGKRRRRGGGSSLRDHLPIGHGLGWCRDTACGCSSRSEHRFASGVYWNPRSYRGARKLLRVYCYRVAGHWLRACKCTLRNHRHRTLHIAVHIVDVCDRGALVHYGCVVNVGDGCRVDCRIADIHLVHVAPANPIRRHINLARA
jgi:hypothetical protein